MKKWISILLILFLMILGETENNPSNNEINDVLLNYSYNFENFNESKLFDYPDNLELSHEDVDKYLFCGALLQMKLKKDLDKIEKIVNAHMNENIPTNVYDQIGSAIIDKCLDKASPKTVHKHFSNGLYIEEITEDYYESYHSYCDVDYITILKEKRENKNQKDLSYIYKVQKALDIHNKRQEEAKKRLEEGNYDIDDNEKLKAVGIDVLNAPYYIKVFLFVIVFGALFGGTLYYINSIINKPKKEKKEKKKKKKN
jgi:hypothetical protein